ncbi:MAG: hypothetical protein AAB358_01445 [Patescibacteria group bacterium]
MLKRSKLKNLDEDWQEKEVDDFNETEISADKIESDNKKEEENDPANLISNGKYKDTKIMLRKKRRKNIQRDLAEVYVDGNGRIPDLSRLKKPPRPAWKTTIYALIGVFAVLLLAAAGGFFLFGKLGGDSFTNERITFKIEPPVNIVSGEEGTYSILITNREKVNLYNLELTMFYPDNFTYASSSDPEATGEKNNIWSFSVLKTGEIKEIKLKGTLTAALNSTQTFRGELRFKPANMNADFKQETILDAMVSSSMISFEVKGPEKILANQETEYDFKYKNLSDKDLVDLQVVADYPDGFTLASSDPDPSDGENDNIWNIINLKAGEEGEIKIKGNYSAITEEGNRDFKARIQLKYQDDYVLQSESSLTTSVVKDQLSLTLVINGSAEDQPINFDDLLFYTLNFKNTGETDLKNIEIAAHLDSQILDWGSLAAGKGIKSTTGVVSWTGKEEPKLLKLKPGQEGEISWQIRVKDAASVGRDASKFSVESDAEATAKQTGAESGEISTKTKTITNSISSDLNLQVQARYYDEDNIPLGLGPITPKVGQTSTYNIKAALLNNLHDIRDLKVTISLPKNVSWAGKENHNTGDLVFDARTNKVTWSISRLAKTAKGAEADFNVSIKPTAADEGKILILVSDSSLAAKDAETGADISKALKAITTAFNDPILGQMDGVVE